MRRTSWRNNSKTSHELAERARSVLTSPTVLSHWQIPDDAELIRGRGRSYKVGKYRVFRFVLSFNGTELPFCLTYGDRASLKTIFESHYAQAPSTSPAAMYVEQGPFLVESYPNDWKLPGLKAALDSQHIQSLLSESSLVGTDKTEVIPRIFRYIPHRRCVISYELRGASQSPDLVGKLFSTSQGAMRSYETLKLLADTPATVDCAPRPVALDKQLRLVIMERLEGSQLSKFLDETEEKQSRKSAIESAAELLAQIHSIKSTGEAPSSLSSSKESIRKLHAQIPPRAAATAADIETALAQLEQLAPEAGDLPEAHSLIHGDFNPRQVLLSEDRARAVDFDGAGPGDPAADVGRFTSSLKARAIEADDPHSRDLADYFVAKYESATGTSISRRARYFEAFGLLYRATRLLVASTFRIVDEPHALIAEASASMALLEN